MINAYVSCKYGAAPKNLDVRPLSRMGQSELLPEWARRTSVGIECIGDCSFRSNLYLFSNLFDFESRSIIKGMSEMRIMPSYQDRMWIRLWRENAPELRHRVVLWRKQNAITRIEKPSRIERARRLGYKAKQGIVVVRMRVGTGGMRKQRPRGGRRPKHLGVTKIKADDNMKIVAERRVLERYPNMSLLGSYFIYKDGMHYWFEVILADPMHPRIAYDKELGPRVHAPVV